MEANSVRLLVWSLFGLLGFFLFIILLQSFTKSRPGSSAPNSTTFLSCATRKISLETLRATTNDFGPSSLIKAGHSGEFFSGYLQDGAEKIVVKKGDAEELKRELDLYISLGDTKWFVPLIGYCGEDKEKFFLVYEFMESGDLGTILAAKELLLPWIVRLKIAVEVADALVFLHNNCTPHILHNNVKSSSVMIGPSYEVRLGSLSQSKQVEDEGLLNHDVQCFGMLLMDLISGLNVSAADDPYAQRWLRKALACPDRASLIGLMDPTLIVEDDLADEMVGVANIAKVCVSGSCWVTMKAVRQALVHPAHISDMGWGVHHLGSPDLSQPRTLILMDAAADDVERDPIS